MFFNLNFVNLQCFCVCVHLWIICMFVCVFHCTLLVHLVFLFKTSIYMYLRWSVYVCICVFLYLQHHENVSVSINIPTTSALQHFWTVLKFSHRRRKCFTRFFLNFLKVVYHSVHCLLHFNICLEHIFLATSNYNVHYIYLNWSWIDNT